MALSWNTQARLITSPVNTTPVLLTFRQYTRSTTEQEDVHVLEAGKRSLKKISQKGEWKSDQLQEWKSTVRYWRGILSKSFRTTLNETVVKIFLMKITFDNNNNIKSIVKDHCPATRGLPTYSTKVLFLVQHLF